MMEVNRMLSKKVKSMEESATIKMAQKSRDLASKGVHVVNLTLGEPDFDTPDFIKHAATVALNKGETKYTPVPGTAALRKAISEKFKNENHLDYSPAQIVVSNGAKQSIANVCLATLDEGDEVIILAPYWVSYSEIVKFCGGTPVVLKSDISTNFKVSASDIDNAVNDRTKLIIFSSPCNPTGSVYSRSELEQIAKVVLKHGHILVISDEIYEYINFSGEHFSIGSVPGMMDYTVTINGFSKGFAMTGWRLGYMGAPLWLVEACNKVQGQVTSGASSFGQSAAVEALMAKRDASMSMCDAFLKRRDLIVGLLKEIKGFKVNLPEGAFYVFPDISDYFGTSNGSLTIRNADDMAEILLTEAHVGTVSGSAFGADNCIRISYAASEDDIKEAVTRIKNCLSFFK
jgi:aspartate aminotransferase